MSGDEYELLRSNIWDHIYKNGPQSVQQLADAMQLTVSTVVGLVDHAWFSMHGEIVQIAKESD